LKIDCIQKTLKILDCNYKEKTHCYANKSCTSPGHAEVKMAVNNMYYVT